MTQDLGALSGSKASPEADKSSSPIGYDPARWHDVANAPFDVPLLVAFDHDADPYQDPDSPGRLTDYAVHAEGGLYVSGRGVTVAVRREGWDEDDGWESCNPPYWMPAAWWEWQDGDSGDRVVNPVAWMPLPTFVFGDPQ